MILKPLIQSNNLLGDNRMKTKLHTDRGQYDCTIMQRIIAGVPCNKDFAKNERIEWLKQLYAQWLLKRDSGLINTKNTYRIEKPD